MKYSKIWTLKWFVAVTWINYSSGMMFLNAVNVGSRHSIFRKEKYRVRSCSRCIDRWFLRGYPDSAEVMESRRGSYSVVESRRRSIWWASRVKKNELRLSYGLTLSYQENYWHWDDICACCVDSQRPCVDFTVVWYDRCRSLSLINARVFRN